MSKSTTGRQMLEALEKRVAELERQNVALMESLRYVPDDAEVIHLSRAVRHRLGENA